MYMLTNIDSKLNIKKLVFFGMGKYRRRAAISCPFIIEAKSRLILLIISIIAKIFWLIYLKVKRLH